MNARLSTLNSSSVIDGPCFCGLSVGVSEPENDLERALWAASRGPEGYPELFRQLRASMIVFLLPYHPEWVGDIPLAEGTPITFAVWENKEGPQVPIFTSVERAEAALQEIGAGEQDFCVGEMKGEWLFGAVAGQKLPAIVNPACGTPTFQLDVRAARKLADGSILKPFEAPPEEGQLKIVDAAEYPTDLLQPVFRFLRGRPEVRAAWLFYRVAGDDPKNRYYVFGLLVTGNAEALKNEVSVVVRHARKNGPDFGVMELDAKKPGLANIMSKFPPFYAAPDYPASPFPTA